MIIKGFIDMIYGLIYLITLPITLLPDVSLPAGFTNAITTANGYLRSLDVIIPIQTVLTLLGIYIAIELAYFTYKLIMWLIKRFPTQS